MRHTSTIKGFTIVELVVVIVVIAILATISIVAYDGVQDEAKTSSGSSLATQVSGKVKAYRSAMAHYPTEAQLKANPPAVPEARLDDNANVLTGVTLAAQRTESTYANGSNVVYRRPSTVSACVIYWDYMASTHKVVLIGAPHSSCT